MRFSKAFYELMPKHQLIREKWKDRDKSRMISGSLAIVAPTRPRLHRGRNGREHL